MAHLFQSEMSVAPIPFSQFSFSQFFPLPASHGAHVCHFWGWCLIHQQLFQWLLCGFGIGRTHLVSFVHWWRHFISFILVHWVLSEEFVILFFLSHMPVFFPSQDPLLCQFLFEIVQDIFTQLAVKPSPHSFMLLLLFVCSSHKDRGLEIDYQNIWYIHTPWFIMESYLPLCGFFSTNLWMTKIDISIAYLYIPIGKHCYPYIQFVHHGVICQFFALPFRLDLALYIFYQLVQTFTLHLHIMRLCFHGQLTSSCLFQTGIDK